MANRYTKKESKIVWFTNQNNGWYQGPFVNKPRYGNSIPYLLTQITEEEAKKLIKNGKNNTTKIY